MNRELPIILNTEMVKAILDDRKVCTRRPVKLPSHKMFKYQGVVKHSVTEKNIGKCFFESMIDDDNLYVKPPYKKDDILYVRETWKYGACSGYTPTNGEDVFKVDITYKAKVKNNNSTKTFRVDEMCSGGNLTKERGVPWKPSIHMPKKYARLFLKVANVRIERLCDISDDDCLKEGIEIISNDPDEYFCRDYSKKRSLENWTFFEENEYKSFKTLWNSIYKNWDSNPWVWVIDFEVVKK